ncbi:ATP-binding protein [uncultured Pseudoxanthomonas sp.]|uniref:AAA family ATPase n=1 Tax=uncultured Pseudoxanthomonas sp. TaxID=281701 RepID=UPI00260D25B6|nr:ATP-binding protein [uncultured Pseudoxanthomonas sp.]
MLVAKRVGLSEILDGRRSPRSEALTILTGENGAGKSRALRFLAEFYGGRRRKVLAISNSSFGRFNRKGDYVRAINFGRPGASPEKILKSTISAAYEKDELQLRSLSRILRYCGYSPEVGFRVNLSERKRPSTLKDEIEAAAAKRGRNSDELISIIYLVTSNEMGGEILWLDFDGFSLESFVRNSIPRILFWERELRSLGYISSIRLFLRSSTSEIALSQASSGELSLITSMALIATTHEEETVLPIDEPENSLHPAWQKEFLSTLLAAIGYKRTTLIIATHSPLIVMGGEDVRMQAEVLVMSAMIESDGQVDVAEKGLEGVMAEVFHTFTSKNHYLSRYLVSLLDYLEGGRLSKAELETIIVKLKEMGLDEKQQAAVRLVQDMANSIEAGNA